MDSNQGGHSRISVGLQMLFESEYLSIEYDPANDMLYMRRTSEPMPGPDELPALFASILRALANYVGKPLLMDLRQGRGNNNPDFERAMKEQTMKVRAVFSNTVMLVRTTAGFLHVQRMARERGERAPRIFIDEAEALASLDAVRRGLPG